MKKILNGLYPVLPTPFDKNDEIVYSDLENMVDFAVKCGVQGITVNEVFSEFYMFTDEERRKVVETVCKRAQGRIPVIVGALAPTPMLQTYWAEHAQDQGAEALLAGSSYMQSFAWEAMLEQGFKVIAERVHIPVILQNTPQERTLGPNLALSFGYDQAKYLMCEYEIYQYVKDDSRSIQDQISKLVDMAATMPEDSFRGIFTGINGPDMHADYLRGATGFMPALHMADYREEEWRYLEAKEYDKALKLQFELSPLYMFELTYMMDVCKRILRHRGVISNIENRRSNMSVFHSVNELELSRVISYLQEKDKLP